MTGEEGFHEKGTSAYCKEGFFPNSKENFRSRKNCTQILEKFRLKKDIKGKNSLNFLK